MLAEKGPQPLPDLLSATGAPLADLLHALRITRDFNLIESLDADGMVRLTPCGSRTADALKAFEIRESATEALEA